MGYNMDKYLKMMIFLTALTVALSFVGSAIAEELKQCKPPMILVVQLTPEQLAERLGYCKVPAPKGHGVYYVMEDGNCVAKVK